MKKSDVQKILDDAARDGFVVPGTKQEEADAVASFSVDLLIAMIADRIKAGEDPTAAAKAVLDLAKEFDESDEVIFDGDKGVSIKEAAEEKKDGN